MIAPDGKDVVSALNGLFGYDLRPLDDARVSNLKPEFDTRANRDFQVYEGTTHQFIESAELSIDVVMKGDTRVSAGFLNAVKPSGPAVFFCQ